MYSPFYPGAPLDVDEAARKIHRLLQREAAARLQPAAQMQLAQVDNDAADPTAEDPMAGWPAMQSPLPTANVRRPDAYSKDGGGFRADRKHNGRIEPHHAIDLATAAGSSVYSPIEGTITHIGKAYANGDDADVLGSIHVTGPDGHKIQILYVEPADGLEVGQRVTPDSLLGQSQTLQRQHKPKSDGAMTDHVHFRFFDPSGRIADPTPWIEQWGRQADNWQRLGRRREW